MFPEYVSFVLQTKHNLDFKKVAVELQAHLSQRLRDQYPKQSRLFHVRAHFDFDMIVIDVSCERRELVAYAQSKNSWPFFHTVILDAVYFLKTFDKRPLVVSYSDSVDIEESIRNTHFINMELFNRSDLLSGTAISFADLSTFFVCTCEGRRRKGDGDN